MSLVMSDTTDITTEAMRAHRCAVSCNIWTSLCLLLLWQLKLDWGFYSGQLANWKASLLTSSGVHPKYIRSINKRQSTNFFSKAEGIVGLRPNFDWVVWKGSQFERTRQVIFFLHLLDIPFLCYKPPCLFVPCFPCLLISTPTFFEFHLQISWKSNASSFSTLSFSLYWTEKIIVQNFTQCVI